MFTYTSLFLVSLLVAIVVRVLYKKASDATGSVYNTKLPDAELAHLEEPVKRAIEIDDNAGTAYPTDLRGRGTYAYLGDEKANDLADNLDFEVAEESSIEWADSPKAPPINGNAAAQTSSHCSLFELEPEEPESKPEPVAAQSAPKEKAETGGKAFGVTGKVATDNMSLDADAKPWGW